MFGVFTLLNRLLSPTNATCSEVPLNSSKFTAFYNSLLIVYPPARTTHIIKTSIKLNKTHTGMRKLLLCVISTELDLRFQILVFSHSSK